MTNERLYTDREVSAILKRSGELQADRGEPGTQGLSIEELQQIAREVGIDPDLVTQAAAELEGEGGVRQGRRWVGIPVDLVVERVVRGEIDEVQWPEIAAEIGDTFGLVGSSAQVGTMLQWTHTGRRFSQLQVTLTPRDGQTKIRVHGIYKHRAFATLLPLSLFGLMQGLFIPLSQGLPILAAAGISLSIAIAIYLLVRVGLTTLIGQKERASRKLMDRIERVLASQKTKKAAPAQMADVSPRIVLDEASQENRAERPEDRRGRRRE
jgi:hypothetical protein